jgi:hypothetical protein
VGCRKVCISINQIMKAHFFLKEFFLNCYLTAYFKNNFLQMTWSFIYFLLYICRPLKIFQGKKIICYIWTKDKKRKRMSKFGFVKSFGVKKLFLILEHLFYNFMRCMVGKDIGLRPWRPRSSSWYQHLLYTYRCTHIYIGRW